MTLAHREISPRVMAHELYRELAQTRSCGHMLTPCYPVRGCPYCEINDALDHYENAMARADGQPVPNVIGRRIS